VGWGRPTQKVKVEELAKGNSACVCVCVQSCRIMAIHTRQRGCECRAGIHTIHLKFITFADYEAVNMEVYCIFK
jgi:hypothetical protein